MDSLEQMMVESQGAWESGRMQKSASAPVALPHRRGGERGAHLVGSPFLLLDAPLVGGHGSVGGRGRGKVISVASAVWGVVRVLIPGWAFGGGGGEDGRWEDALK